jgi:hypothetical protein
MITSPEHPLRALSFDSWSESLFESSSSYKPAKINSPLSRFVIVLRGVVRALGWEDSPHVAGGIFVVVVVVADGDYYFHDGIWRLCVHQVVATLWTDIFASSGREKIDDILTTL